MYLLIVFIPLFSFLLLTLFGSQLSKKHLLNINLGLIFFCWLLSIIIFYEVIYNKLTCNIFLWEWICVGSLRLSFNFYFDYLTAIMLFVVFSISSLVHLYSLDYMSTDPFIIRFLAYLSLFTFFMIFLVTAGNIVQFFFGWEGVGSSPYLLINFWYTRIQANKAAIKAIIVNRFGDFGLYASICIIFLLYGNFNFEFIFTFTVKNSLIDILILLLLIAAIGKSAQIGLQTWLSDAMEGPTPVSALIHAATMVTAGMFLLIRFSFLLEQSSYSLLMIALTGAITIFFAGTVGIFQNDIKKIIAFSTCSQLGYMLFACGLSNYNVSLFHLFNHAFFKALLFLGAGSIIHAVSDEQDIRKMGGLTQLLPVTYIIMLIGSLSLMGIPFLSGFYSKDLILEIANAEFQINNYFLFVLTTLSVFLTAFYSIRLLYYVFFGETIKVQSGNIQIRESNNIVLFVFIILAIFSICSGYFFRDLFVGVGINFIYTRNYIFFDAEYGIPLWVKFIPLICTFGGSLLAFHIFLHFLPISYILNYRFFCSLMNRYIFHIYRFFNQQWFFNYIYNNYLTFIVLRFSYYIGLKLIDRGALEYFGPFGIVNVVRSFALKISRLQTGYIFNYIVFMIMALVLLVNIIYFQSYSFEDSCLLIGLLVFFALFDTVKMSNVDYYFIISKSNLMVVSHFILLILFIESVISFNNYFWLKYGLFLFFFILFLISCISLFIPRSSSLLIWLTKWWWYFMCTIIILNFIIMFPTNPLTIIVLYTFYISILLGCLFFFFLICYKYIV